MTPRSRTTLAISATALLVVCAAPGLANAPTPLSTPEAITFPEDVAGFYKQILTTNDVFQQQDPTGNAASLVLFSRSPNYFANLVQREDFYRKSFEVWKREKGVSFAEQADQELLRLVVYAQTLDELEQVCM